MNHDSLSDGSALMRGAQQYLRDIARTREALDCTPAGAGASMLCVTDSAGAYPSEAQATYVVRPVELVCEDDEGAAATALADPGVALYAVNTGSQVPPQGTIVIAHSVGGRWCFHYNG